MSDSVITIPILHLCETCAKDWLQPPYTGGFAITPSMRTVMTGLICEECQKQLDSK
jgi:hypothetical protein